MPGRLIPGDQQLFVLYKCPSPRSLPRPWRPATVVIVLPRSSINLHLMQRLSRRRKIPVRRSPFRNADTSGKARVKARLLPRCRLLSQGHVSSGKSVHHLLRLAPRRYRKARDPILLVVNVKMKVGIKPQAPSHVKGVAGARAMTRQAHLDLVGDVMEAMIYQVHSDLVLTVMINAAANGIISSYPSASALLRPLLSLKTLRRSLRLVPPHMHLRRRLPRKSSPLIYPRRLH